MNERPGLICQKCGLPFAIGAAGEFGARRVEHLPDPFEATCSVCQHTATYPKSAIESLEADSRQ